MPSSTAILDHIERKPPTYANATLFAVFLAMSLLFCTDAALAKEKSGNATSEKSTTDRSATKKKSVSKVTYQRSASEESPAQRDRRLFRECKGMHNAGACRGYTR